MKKILSILATIAGITYVAAGIGLLAFQNVVKTTMGYGTDCGLNSINVYPVGNMLELALLGIPCVVLGVLSMAETSEHKKGVNLLLIIYSSVMLVLAGLLTNVASFVNNFIISRTLGVEGLANVNIVSAAFSWIRSLINLSLVLLLLRGALSLGAETLYQK